MDQGRGGGAEPRLKGPHRCLCSAGTSATLLLLGDLFARTVISPVILPIGAITSFLGGPLFLYLLFKGGKKQ